MIPLIAALIGFAVGWVRAGRRGGGRADKWQYAVAHAVALGLIAFFVSLVMLRFGLLPPLPWS